MSNTTPQPNFPSPTQNAPQYPGAPGQQPQAPQQTVPAPPYARAAAPQNPSTRMGDTNTFAVLAIIFAFVAPIAGIIFGHLALSQIKRNGDAGRGIGLTGLIISYSYFVLLAIFIVAYIGLLIMMFGAMGAAFSEIGSVSSYDSYDY
ncbi:DUF4190 domain-containing protein [Leucobacter sp. GX24907]